VNNYSLLHYYTQDKLLFILCTVFRDWYVSPMVQLTWGFPSYPGGHWHTGRWLVTVHNAPGPQLHGFSQCSLRQARL